MLRLKTAFDQILSCCSSVRGAPAAVILAALVAACGGGGGGSGGTSGTGSTGTTTTNLSDPANQCSDQYSHVYVTVRDVQASMGGSGNGGFVDLTPKLSAKPVQVDLLAAPNSECFLAELGVKSGLPAGNYQQIRLFLVDNSTSGIMLANGASNQCGGNSGPWNCVVQTGAAAPDTLTLPSEAQTGLKIPPGQIAGGGIKLAAGQSVDIVIDFNACTSVVQAGKSGKFLLKPTLRASEVGTSPLIAGTVVLATASGGTVVPGATTVPNANVWLEQEPASADFTVGTPEAAGGAAPSVSVESLVQTTTADGSGHFEFCPVGPGTYDIVVDAPSLPTSNLPANATVAVGANVTTNGGPNNLVVPLVAEASTAATPAWGQISAIVTTVNTGAAGDDVTLSGLQAFRPPGGSSALQAQVPLLYDLSGTDGTMPTGVPPTVTTSSAFSSANCPALSSVSSCPTGINCACFNVAVPASNPVVGIVNTDGSGYVAPAAGTVGYAIAGVATVENGSSSDLICSPSNLVTNPAALIAVTPGTVTTPTNPILQFTGCD